jgi:hypothetical protein
LCVINGQALRAVRDNLSRDTIVVNEGSGTMDVGGFGSSVPSWLSLVASSIFVGDMMRSRASLTMLLSVL